MAANDEFPRGWVSSTFVTTTAVIDVPQSPGVAHVLDEVQAKCNVNNQPTGQIFQIAVLDLASLSVLFYAGIMGLSTTAANVVASDSTDWAGPYEGLVGQGLRITYTAAGLAGTQQFLSVKGHDV